MKRMKKAVRPKDTSRMFKLATTAANAENRQLIFFVFVLEFEQTRGNYAVTWMVVKSGTTAQPKPPAYTAKCDPLDSEPHDSRAMVIQCQLERHNYYYLLCGSRTEKSIQKIVQCVITTTRGGSQVERRWLVGTGGHKSGRGYGFFMSRLNFGSRRPCTTFET